jgi:methylated-DNA-[protein]-cysteine S-methyltransferase
MTTLTSRDIDTPAGSVRLTFSGATLVGLVFADRWERFERSLERRFGAFTLGAANGVTDDAAARLGAYLDGDFAALDRISFETGGTPFQRRVWERLRAIPCGQTLSYGALAESIGQPAATRAVAAANGRNPISIVIPCHRVIAKDGTLWGYGGGLDRKRWLLAHEGALGTELELG